MHPTRDRQELEQSLQAFESMAFNFAVRFVNDGNARVKYLDSARKLSSEILREVESGRISAHEGANRAKELRNILMEEIRRKSSDFGRSVAQNTKQVGLSLLELQEKYAQKIFSRTFSQLSEAERGQVWREIVFASGRPNPKFNLLARRMKVAGRAFLMLTIAISVYNITAAEDKTKAVAEEGAVISGGFVGSVAGGAAAGLACGPGAPLCVGIGIFLGGFMFAAGADYMFDQFWRY